MISQSVYFCYDFLDLAHAAGQPASAAKAFDSQASQLLRQQPALSHNRARVVSSLARIGSHRSGA